MGGGNGKMKDRVSVCISLLLVASSLLLQARPSQAELTDEGLQLAAGFLFIIWLRQEFIIKAFMKDVCVEGNEVEEVGISLQTWNEMCVVYEAARTLNGADFQTYLEAREGLPDDWRAAERTLAFYWLIYRRHELSETFAVFVCDIAPRLFEVLPGVTEEDRDDLQQTCAWLRGGGKQEDRFQKIVNTKENELSSIVRSPRGKDEPVDLKQFRQASSDGTAPAPSKAVLLLGGLLTLALPLLHLDGNKHPLPKSPDPTA